MHGSRLLRERTYHCRAYLTVDAAAVCIDAKAVFLCVLFVVSLPRLLSCLVDVSGRALSPGRCKEAWDLFLRAKALASLVCHIFADLLPSVDVLPTSLGCRGLRCAGLESCRGCNVHT